MAAYTSAALPEPVPTRSAAYTVVSWSSISYPAAAIPQVRVRVWNGTAWVIAPAS